MSDVPIGNADPVGFILSSIAENVSATQAVRAYRAAGGAMGNEAWYKLYGDIRQAVGNREPIQGLDYAVQPSVDALSTWAAGEAGQQATFVQSYLHVPGSRDVRVVPFIHVTTGPHTPQEAIDEAQRLIGEGQRTGTGPVGEVLYGTVVTSVARMTGKRTA